MSTITQIKRRHEALYEELVDNLSALKEDTKKAITFSENVKQLLDDIRLAAVDVRTIEDYEWLNQTTVNWQAALSTILELPTDVQEIPLPQQVQGYARGSRGQMEVTGRFKDLIHLTQEFVDRHKGVWASADWLNYFQELQKGGFELSDEYRRYYELIIETTKTMIGLERPVQRLKEVVTLSEEFVEKQKGIWEHPSWLNFLLDIQRHGLGASNDLIDYYGELLEAMKGLYCTLERTRGMEIRMSDIIDRLMTFFEDHQGIWDQAAWEKLVNDIRQKEVHLTDEAEAYVGHVLEALKRLHLAQLGRKNEV